MNRALLVILVEMLLLPAPCLPGQENYILIETCLDQYSRKYSSEYRYFDGTRLASRHVTAGAAPGVRTTEYRGSQNGSLQRFKFEGKELDRSFGLDWYDIHARQYDGLAPGWNRPDDKAHDYTPINPYAYCAGDPVNYGDWDGREVKISPCPNGIIENICYTISSLLGLDYKTNFQRKVESDIDTAKEKSPALKAFIEKMEQNPDVTVSIKISNSENKTIISNIDKDKDGSDLPTNSTIYYNPYKDTNKQRTCRPPIVGLMNEMGHAYAYMFGTADSQHVFIHPLDMNHHEVGVSEFNEAFMFENLLRDALGIQHRTTYGGRPITEFVKQKK